MLFDIDKTYWLNEPQEKRVNASEIIIKTEADTDLWKRTYYGFERDDAPMLLMKTKEQFFSFVVKVHFSSQVAYDQAGVVIYLDTDNWFKGSIEYENEEFQRMGSVVCNNGYSDWATQDISSSIKEMWYRLSRRNSDFYLEYSEDGDNFKQMRIFHLFAAENEIAFGLYACSPGESTFEAKFTDFQMIENTWELE